MQLHCLFWYIFTGKCLYGDYREGQMFSLTCAGSCGHQSRRNGSLNNRKAISSNTQRVAKLFKLPNWMCLKETNAFEKETQL